MFINVIIFYCFKIVINNEQTAEKQDYRSNNQSNVKQQTTIASSQNIDVYLFIYFILNIFLFDNIYK